MRAAKDELGSEGELLARAHLRDKGHTILTSNYRGRIGELDIVSLDRGVVVFTEVKARRGQSRGEGFESVTKTKQAKLRRLAELYMLDEFHTLKTCRFDVVSISWETGRPEIKHLENAFW